MTTTQLEQLHARRDAHQRAIDEKERWLTPSLLALKWGVSVTTVKAIPADKLPFLAFGRGGKRRRYNPEDVARYEREGRDAARRAS